jgi:peptide alpha-N-acetyltransferase
VCCLPSLLLQEEKRKTEAAAAAAAEAAKQQAGSSEGGGSSGNKGGKKKGSSRPPDPDPDGTKLAATADPLGEATKFVVMLKQVRDIAGCAREVHTCIRHSA